MSEKGLVPESVFSIAKETNQGKHNSAFYKRSLRRRKGLTDMKDFVLIVLPPTSVLPDLYPERLFTPRLVQWENRLVQLQSVAAFYATLGGGYFLCRYLSTAVVLARKQRAICVAMGDYEAADRCTINEAYNYIHAGHFNRALALIRSVKKEAKQRDDTITVKMSNSALLFCKRVRRASKYDDSNNGDTTTAESSSGHAMRPNRKESTQGTLSRAKIQATSTVDDYQRIRIVKDRTRNAI